MRKVSIIAALALALTGCGNDRQRGVDGYVFEGKQFDHSEVVVRRVLYPSLSALRAGAQARGNKDYARVIAYSVISADGVCTIHIVDPSVDYLPQYAGHELYHCFFGEWHPMFTLAQRK
jgi:hypothetical protein